MEEVSNYTDDPTTEIEQLIPEDSKMQSPPPHWPPKKQSFIPELLFSPEGRLLSILFI